jgi:hypothetical protein
VQTLGTSAGITGFGRFQVLARLSISVDIAGWSILVPVTSDYWMAEVRFEDSTSNNEFVISTNDWSFMPFALSGAFSLISIHAFEEGSDILGLKLNCTEVFCLWDHFDSIAQDTWCSTGSGWLVKALFPISSCGFLNVSNLVAEFSGSTWCISFHESLTFTVSENTSFSS